MSQITGIAHYGIISHVVQASDGNIYAVSSTNAFDRKQSPWETAVFRWNKRDKKITNWVDLIRIHDSTEEAMMITHELVCENLENYLKSTKTRSLTAMAG